MEIELMMTISNLDNWESLSVGIHPAISTDVLLLRGGTAVVT